MKQLAIILILVSCAFARTSRYNHVGQMDKRADTTPADLPKAMQGYYYSGQDICAPASDNHPADCRKPDDWMLTDIGPTTITLDDGTSFDVEGNGHSRRSIFDRTVDAWLTKRLLHNVRGTSYDPNQSGAAAHGTFRYRVLGKVANGSQKIKIQGIGKGSYTIARK